MEHLITHVEPGSPALRHGLRQGDTLLAINGEEIIDQIDYEALSARRHLILHVRKADGRDWQLELVKPAGIPLGLDFGESMACTPRVCKNKCMFCFIDQMPPACRKTLYVKDDDWRMSLMMGNFITLTNVDDQEFDRILRRRASPLFISVHATDPAVRVKMMKNPDAAKLLPRLRQFKEHGIKFHCQIVLCPGINDGAVLEDTLQTLFTLHPAAQSAALVPVGLTKFREHLYPLRPYTKEEAEEVLAICKKWQDRFMDLCGSKFVFPSDEMLCIAGRDVPDEDYYEGFPQIENGVGLMRQFLTAFIAAHDAAPAGVQAQHRRILIPCGRSIAPYMRRWIAQYGPPGVDVTVQAITNHFFGDTVTVTGLLTGRDIVAQTKDADVDEMLLCSVTLRAEGDLFLDDLSLDEFRRMLPFPVRMSTNSGAALYQSLLGDIEKEST